MVVYPPLLAVVAAGISTVTSVGAVHVRQLRGPAQHAASIVPVEPGDVDFADPPELLRDIPQPPAPPPQPPPEPALPPEPPAEGVVAQPVPPLPEDFAQTVPAVATTDADGPIGEEATVIDTSEAGPAIEPPQAPIEAVAEPPQQLVAPTTTTTTAIQAAKPAVSPAVAAMSAAAELRADAGSLDPADQEVSARQSRRLIVPHMGGLDCETECSSACGQAQTKTKVDCSSECAGACDDRFGQRELRGGGFTKVVKTFPPVAVPLPVPHAPPALPSSVQGLVPPDGLMPHRSGTDSLKVYGASDLMPLPELPHDLQPQVSHQPPPPLPEWLRGPAPYSK